jgi:transposase
MTIVNYHIGVQKRNGKVYYFNGSLPYCHHREDDRESFKTAVCQMISNGNASRLEVSKSFHIPARSISRWLDTFEKEGEGCFFRKKKRREFASSQARQ